MTASFVETPFLCPFRDWCHHSLSLLTYLGFRFCMKTSLVSGGFVLYCCLLQSLSGGILRLYVLCTPQHTHTHTHTHTTHTHTHTHIYIYIYSKLTDRRWQRHEGFFIATTLRYRGALFLFVDYSTLPLISILENWVISKDWSSTIFWSFVWLTSDWTPFSRTIVEDSNHDAIYIYIYICIYIYIYQQILT